ncbi:UDP-phosphate glycosyltransferase [Arthrobacter sp. GCM10027362]|uniref:UDP-phosphate glycosyltransferase n=1 Tax=Arthrobacter sp. GCM10027362 TaxID=3273379 RepID=UPI00363EF795
MNFALLAVAAAFLLSLLLPFGLKPLLVRLGVLDVPNERSSHTVVTVRGMGLTVAAGLLAGLLLALPAVDTEDRPLLGTVAAVAGAAALLGWTEDYRGISIRVRALLQVVVGAGGTVLAVYLTESSWWWVPVGALAVAGYINAANFMDGINGISGLHGLGTGLLFAAAGALAEERWLVLAGLVVAVSFAAFLPWNLGRDNVFLGDVGSYLLGASLAVLGVAGFLAGVPAESLLGPVTIYLADTAATLLRRVRAGEQWYVPHRQHVYQRLTDTGFSHLQSAAFVTGCSVLTGLCGFLAAQSELAGKLAALLGCAAVVVFYLRSPAIFGKHRTQPADAG